MKDQALKFYRDMVAIRLFEETGIELYKEGLVGGSYHSYIGQEAVAVGVCSALRLDDYITTTYRGRGQHLAKGADPYKLFAEILGRVDGYCGGKGGPMHIADPDIGILGANGIVAAGVPIAAGAALSSRIEKGDKVAAAFFGDGAVNQGVFSETLNLTALWDLPMIFVCENNLYAEMTPLHKSVKNVNLSERAAAFGMPGVIVDGNDVEAVYRTAEEAVQRARNGDGPTFIEARTYRLQGHMYGDTEIYRSKEEVAEWKNRDPIQRLRERLLSQGWATEASLTALEQETADWLRAAAEKARLSPEPTADAIPVDVH
jgi:pyruvate dehydrogenase E1 component alpha subunit